MRIFATKGVIIVEFCIIAEITLLFLIVAVMFLIQLFYCCIIRQKNTKIYTYG